jgi:hypothetical protein
MPSWWTTPALIIGVRSKVTPSPPVSKNTAEPMTVPRAIW